MRPLWTLLLSLALACAGCPAPTQPPGGGGSSGGPSPGSGPGGGPGGGPGDPAPEVAPDAPWTPRAAPDWEVIPEEALAQDVFRMIRPLRRWPDPSTLRPLAQLPAAERPDPTRVRLLVELVTYLVHEDLRPRDPQAALGVDARGKLFIRLGRTRTVGSATLECEDEEASFPVFGVVLRGGGTAPKDAAGLQERVNGAIVAELAREMRRSPHGLELHPQVRGGKPGIAGLALLDRSGYGVQFPYLYGYAAGDHLIVLLQEVPHTEDSAHRPQ